MFCQNWMTINVTIMWVKCERFFARHDFDLNSLNNKGRTTFQLACWYGHAETAKMLIQKSDKNFVDDVITYSLSSVILEYC